MKNLRSASVRRQLFVLAILLVVLVSTIATLSEPFIYGRHDKGIEIGLYSGRIELILDKFQRSRTTREEDDVLRFAKEVEVTVERSSPLQATMAYEAGNTRNVIVSRVRELINDGFLNSLENAFEKTNVSGVLAIKVDEERALSFHMPVFPSSVWLAPAVASGLLKIIIPLILLAYLGSWLISEPLVRFAAAAKRVSMDDNSDEPFKAEGASEIRSLANSLNTMQGRIQVMLTERTKMLRAVSHDLRTPLTRLRMRAERSNEPELRRLMLSDITTLGSMIDDSLAFLDNTPEPSRKVDMSSLLQTICADFSDTGLNVVFTGPRRLTYVCKPQSITRAISNLVDNASRYATKIEVGLGQSAQGGVRITVGDNGPGLSDALKEQVLQPFFKVDQARKSGAKNGRFGLGLTIAQGVVQTGHKGTFALLDAKPNGLVIEINLPPDPSS